MIWLFPTSDKVYLTTNLGGFPTVNTFDTSKWFHVFAAFHETKGVRELWVDGVKQEFGSLMFGPYPALDGNLFAKNHPHFYLGYRDTDGQNAAGDMFCFILSAIENADEVVTTETMNKFMNACK